MKGFILAAGLGSRLKPWTDQHPKALVPVGGVPMLQRVVTTLQSVGIHDISVNVYHFADQIIDYVKAQGWDIKISDERPALLETGGGLLHATPLLEGDEPILVHNADILSNADFKAMERTFEELHPDALLLVSDRNSSRKLVFDGNMKLKGWRNIVTGQWRPEGLVREPNDKELAFSGIYMVSPGIFQKMREDGREGHFSIMDFFLSNVSVLDIYGLNDDDLSLIDIGKPDSLNRANSLFS